MFDWDEKKNDEKGGEQMGGKIIKAFHSLVEERRKMGWVIFHLGPQTSFSLNFRKKWGENVQARNALTILSFGTHLTKYVFSFFNVTWAILYKGKLSFFIFTFFFSTKNKENLYLFSIFCTK